MDNNINRHGLRRRIRVTAVALGALIASLLPAGIHAEELFSELTSYPDVQSSYVSGRFSHNKKSWYSASGQHSMNLSRGFSALYTYQCYSKTAVAKAQSILDKYLKNNSDIEMVMRTQQQGMEYVIYEKFGKDGKLYQMIIWSKDEPSLCEIVVIDWKDGLQPGTDEKYGEKNTSCLNPGELRQMSQFKYRPLL